MCCRAGSCSCAGPPTPEEGGSQPAACLHFVLILPFILALRARVSQWNRRAGNALQGAERVGLRGGHSKHSLLPLRVRRWGQRGEQLHSTGGKRISLEGENKGSGGVFKQQGTELEAEEGMEDGGGVGGEGGKDGGGAV